MLIPNQISYDESHPTWFFWKIGSPLIIKLICRYTPSILFKINFLILWLTPTCNALCKEFSTKHFHQTPGRNRKINTKHSIFYRNFYKKIVILSSIRTIRLQNLLIAINPKPNGLLLVALNIKFLSNLQPFIHKVNIWV